MTISTVKTIICIVTITITVVTATSEIAVESLKDIHTLRYKARALQG